MDCKDCIYSYKERGYSAYQKEKRISGWIKGKKNMCVLFGAQRENCKEKKVEG